MLTVCTTNQMVLRSVCGSLGTVSCQLTFLLVQENLVPAGAACVIGKLVSCLVCELSGVLSYRENIKVNSFFSHRVPCAHLGLGVVLAH